MYGTNGTEDALRMRRNEYFASPEGSVADFPTYPPFSEIPFSQARRRRQGNQFVRWSMRAVLASPVIVLVLWSTCAILFTSKQSTQVKANNRQHKPTPKQRMVKIRNPFGSTASGNTNNGFVSNTESPPQLQYMTPQGGVPPPPQRSSYMVTPGQYMATSQQQQQADGSLQNQAQPGPKYLIQQPNGQYVAAQPEVVNSQGYMLINEELIDQQQQQNQVNPQPYTVSAPQTVVSPQEFMKAREKGGKMIPVITPMGATSTGTNSQLIVEPQQQQQAQVYGASQNVGQATNVLGEQQPVAQTPILGNTAPVAEVAGEALGIADKSRISTHYRPAPRATVDTPVKQQGQQQVYYYYDPKEATKNGELQIPSTVYDSNGTPINLHALQGSQIFLEPPQQKLAVETPERKLAGVTTSLKPLKPWGQSTSQDQSIIVSTVAVMALLVGALSARRLRSRSFLSSCIENESLEDDVAYDTAYTTTDNSYNTFGGWKGDLEKFDV